MKPALLIALMANGLLAAAGSGQDAVPLFFVANSGQAPEEVRFMAKGSGVTAYFAPGEVVLRVGETPVRMRFEGANPRAAIEATGRLPGVVNFLTGTEETWRVDVALFGAVRYRGLYRGIDMVYGGNGRDLKSEYVVSPGADSRQIRVRYEGASELRIAEDGALLILVNGQELREQAPVIYQVVDGTRTPVEGRFALDPDGAVRFAIGEYRIARPLIIDPALYYSTLLGGANSDAATALAVNPAGAAYVAGFTSSYNFPTASPEQNFNGGGNDVFVAKLNASGNALVYCTYLGGSGDDRASAIAVDANGAVYVTGSTTSTNFPVRYPLQSKLMGSKNAFVAKLNATGNSLVYSTYLGGTASDTGYGIAVDAGGSAYIVGDTTSVNFPANGYARGNRGGQDVFVAKLSADGSRLEYSTYFGGNSDDHGAAIAVDAGGSAYFTGSTYSTDFPSVNAAQGHIAGGQDAFVARLSADGSTPLFSTYLGGSGGSLSYPESGQGIALDAQGNAYVAGVTSSANFPLLGALQSSLRGWTDAFVSKLSGSGTLVYSTYLGGTGMEYGNAIAVDAGGSTFVTGYTLSSDLPVINALQSAPGGDYDAFVAKLNASGSTLAYLSYLGGNGSDTGTALALDTAGNLYVAGWTLSTNFPLLNAYQSTNAGNYGAFVAKMLFNQPPVNVGVTPNSGSGVTQTFAFQFSDPNGAADLTTVSVLFNSTLALANACSVIYDRAQNTLAMLTDAGGVASTITPGSGSQQNSQCILNGSSSTVTLAGNVLTLSLAITFQTTFTGTKNIYMQAVSPWGTANWQQVGAWSASSGPPVAVSVTPSSGTGTSQTFTFLYSHPKGYTAISSVSMIVNSTLTRVGGCSLVYSPASNTLYLQNDAATAWLGPVTPGQSGTLQNSQCMVSAPSSSVSGSGSSLTVNLVLSFQAVFAGNKYTYMEVFDGVLDSGWVQRGSWTVPGWGPPSAVSVTPSSGSGPAQTFAFLYSHPNGYAAISSVSVIVNSTLTRAGGCSLLYYRGSNTLYLQNDPATAWLGPITPGQSGALQNSQCTVNATTSSVAGSGTNLSVNLALNFTPSFAGNKYTYMEVFDGVQDSGWVQRGTWNVTAGSPPTAVSVSPSSGSGSSRTFTFLFSAASGYAAIATTSVLVNSSLTTSAGCYVLYNRASNSVSLANNAGTTWLGPVTLGQSANLENSQCGVDAATSSATGSGNSLTVNLTLSFQSAFQGARYIYMSANDGVQDSGWQQRGSWTVVGGTAGPPMPVSVTPASGSGASQTFSFLFTDPNGYTAISSGSVIVASTLTRVGSCSLLYSRASNTLYLQNDPATTWLGPVTLGQSGTLQNSQCTLNAASSSVSGSGANLTVNLALSFQPTFSAAKNVYMEAYDGVLDSGWKQYSIWTIP